MDELSLSPAPRTTVTEFVLTPGRQHPNQVGDGILTINVWLSINPEDVYTIQLPVNVNKVVVVANA